jgi:hypothetical protein
MAFRPLACWVLAVACGLATGSGRVWAQFECPACNGSPLLCDRRYNEVAFPTTHNAMSNRQDHWLAPNQNFNITHQLNDGVRAMMLDVHYFLGNTYLAHGNVLFGHKSLVDGLREVRTFLDGHRCEVVTLIFENRVQAKDLALAFHDAGLLDYVYTHPQGLPFPTLRQMVETNRRLVVFTDRGGGGEHPWLHPLWDYCVETPWKAKRPEELTSQKNRGETGNALFILNHFLTRPTASPRLAQQVNHNPFFGERVNRFLRETGRLPNFVVVDYYDIGDLFEVVDTVNEIPWPQRRKAVVAAHPIAGHPETFGAALGPTELFSPDLIPNRGQ